MVISTYFKFLRSRNFTTSNIEKLFFLWSILVLGFRCYSFLAIFTFSSYKYAIFHIADLYSSLNLLSITTVVVPLSENVFLAMFHYTVTHFSYSHFNNCSMMNSDIFLAYLRAEKCVSYALPDWFILYSACALPWIVSGLSSPDRACHVTSLMSTQAIELMSHSLFS
jgi:hypothetical protein